MARPQFELIVTLSVLDRLIDTDPKASTEVPLSRAQTVRRLKEAVRRDLEWLLNTRRIAVEPDEALRELNRSLYVYGLPDLSSASLASSKDQMSLLKSLQSTVKFFEPRIVNPRVVPVEEAGSRTRTLRFRIDGTLMMEPAPEHVSFDTVIELKSGAAQVKGEGDAG
jgi:type VI secretion system protein ImpF